MNVLHFQGILQISWQRFICRLLSGAKKPLGRQQGSLEN